MSVLLKLREQIESNLHRCHIEKLVAGHFGINSPECKIIMHACDVSCTTLRDTGKTRRNGEPLISHERAMFIIAFVYLGIRDVVMLSSIFMHDMYEDYPRICPLLRIRKDFSIEVQDLVFAVSKPKRRLYHSDASFNKAIFSKVHKGGIRSMILKCIDRLHNMLTLYGSPEKMEAKILQTFEFVLPISIECKTLRVELSEVTTEQIRSLNLVSISIDILND